METPEPGERRPSLARPPSERFATPEPAAAGTSDVAPGDSSPTMRAVAVALGGALAIAILGGPLSLTVGLVVVAALIGWATGSILRPALGPAVVLAAASVVIGLVGIWLYAGYEGGVLSLTDYLGQVEGPIAPLLIVIAALVAAGTAR